MLHHVPVEKICEKLKGKDAQICELQYGNIYINQIIYLTFI